MYNTGTRGGLLSRYSILNWFFYPSLLVELTVRDVIIMGINNAIVII